MPSPDPATGQALPRPARLAAAALGRRWKLPPATSDVRVLRGVAVPVRDGAALRADVYLPDSAQKHPTVLLRSPYRRTGAFPSLFALPYARRGYAVVLQSVRGTFGSEGEFTPVVNEEHDGRDTVAWLREQPWFDGRLATLGPSYLGYTQWALALDPPPELQAMVVHIGPHDLAAAGLLDGAFQLLNVATWTELIAHQDLLGPIRGATRLLTAERRLAPHLHRLPLQGLPERLGGNPAPWFDEWLDHPDLSDPYWDRYRATPAVHSSTVPTLLVSGWQDWFVEQTLYQYAALRDRGVDVGLTMGPWSHLAIDPKVTTAESLAWLATHLPVKPDGSGTRPIPTGSASTSPARTSGGGWRTGRPPVEPSAPGSSHRRRTTGRPRTTRGRRETSFRYDPMNPTPSVGGRVLTFRAGRRDNRRLEARDDVRTFTTEPLESAVELLGGARIRLCLTSDNPYADVFLRLCDVDARGRSVNVTDRLVRLDPADGETPRTDERNVEATLPDTAHRFLPGHRIRLQVSGGAHPRYARNLGTGEPAGLATHGVPVTHRIAHSAVSASSITVPVG